MNEKYLPMKEEPCKERAGMPDPAADRASLADIARKTSAIASDALALAVNINGYLFGECRPIREKETEPRCFRDELTKTLSDIDETFEELQKLSAMIGM